MEIHELQINRDQTNLNFIRPEKRTIVLCFVYCKIILFASITNLNNCLLMNVTRVCVCGVQRRCCILFQFCVEYALTSSIHISISYSTLSSTIKFNHWSGVLCELLFAKAGQQNVHVFTIESFLQHFISIYNQVGSAF